MEQRLRRISPLAAAGALLAAVATVPAASASTSTSTGTSTGTSPGTSASTESARAAGFLSQSTSWLDKHTGFLLGVDPCGSSTCTQVLGTKDGGRTWDTLGRVHAPITRDGSKKAGVDEVRFGDPDHGWAFGPMLRHTDDGGQTWTSEPIPGGQGQVLDLATDADGTWAVLSPCKWQHSGACRKHDLTLWRTTSPTGTDWTQVDASLPYNFDADVSALGSAVYVTDPQLEFGGDDVLLMSSDGKTFASRTAPCDHTQDIQLIQAVPTSATNASFLCDGDPGFSKAVKIVYDSTDSGVTFRNRGTMGLYGIQAELAASPSGNLAVASWSDGSFIYINDSHAKTWKMPVGLGDGGLGWNDIVYVSNREAYVVYSPVGSFEGQGRLWVTHDAGRDWQDVSPQL